MDYSKYVYVASCIFTEIYPQLSIRIQEYIKERFDMRITRCCLPNYKVQEFENRMPEWMRPRWKDLPTHQEFVQEDTAICICPNCIAFLQEAEKPISCLSLWELILSDKEFPFPNYAHEKMTIQDCWRSRDNRFEQDAVRALLTNMNVDTLELPDNYEKTQFCGTTLYQRAPKRNQVLAPVRYGINAQGKFLPHTEEEISGLMQEHCSGIVTDKVVAYCHACVKGLALGGKTAIHLAELLFPPKP